MVAQAAKKRRCAMAMESSPMKTRIDEGGDVARGRRRNDLMVRARCTTVRSLEGDWFDADALTLLSTPAPPSLATTSVESPTSIASSTIRLSPHRRFDAFLLSIVGDSAPPFSVTISVKQKSGTYTYKRNAGYGNFLYGLYHMSVYPRWKQSDNVP
ncbi:hypothetical protein U1Q18_003795 [Sarracenia purpurea var. burkii]